MYQMYDKLYTIHFTKNKIVEYTSSRKQKLANKGSWKMKKLLILVSVLLTASMAKADGFECQTVAGDLNIKVYNQVMPSAGTRNGAVMVVSDPAVSAGRKTVSVFTAEEGTLVNTGSKHYANVDERFNNIPKGEYLSGTRIDYLKSIILDVDFSYNEPVSFGDMVEGWMILTRENGGPQIKEAVLCERYLKH